MRRVARSHHPTSALIMTAEQALIRNRREGWRGWKRRMQGKCEERKERERERVRSERENVQEDEERD